MIKLGNQEITLKVGSNDVSAAYLGSTLVYSGGTPPTPVIPDNTIIYEASAKLNETTSTYGAGLHKNSFSGSTGRLTMISHTFSNGVGTIVFNGGITKIGDYAFLNGSLITVHLPDSVTTIRESAFAQTSLQSIVLGINVMSLGNTAFANNATLTSITCLATTPPTLGTNTFKNSSCPIYVPAQSVSAYQSASGWSDYASRIQAIP